MPLSYFIWIFHYKERPNYIHHVDLNPLNNAIDNLKSGSLTNLQAMCRTKRIGYKKKINKDGSISFRVQIEHNYKKINIGTFKCETIAKKIYEKSRDILEGGIHDPIEIKKQISACFPHEKIILVNNKLGKGVYQNHNKFVARISRQGKTIIIGTYYSPEEARNAYLKYLEENKK